MSWTTCRLFGGFATLLLMAAVESWSQSTQAIQFNLSTPGARSLGMGGAFLGLADDATAAYTNPAGLSNLVIGGSEAAIEFRLWDYSTTFVERGHLLESPTGIGLDTVAGIDRGESQSKANGLSFVSVGYVLPKGFTLAVYHHQLAKYSTDNLSQGVFILPREFAEIDLSEVCIQQSPFTVTFPQFNPCRLPPSRVHQQISIENSGFSVAYAVEQSALSRHDQSLSLGLGISYYQLSEDSRLDFLFFQPSSGLPFQQRDRGVGGLFGPADTLDDNVVLSQVTVGEDSTLGYSAGFLWKLGKQQRWSLGGVYRPGPKFSLPVRAVVGPKFSEAFGEVDELSAAPTSLKVPDVYGLGVAYTSRNGNLKVALDVDRIGWSERLPEIVTNPDLRREHRLDDVNEIHLGIESVVFDIGSQFVGTVRLGVWNDPAHEAVRVRGVTDQFRRLFPEGEDDLHWSGGFGLVIKEDFQIDAALDLSDRVNTVSFSVVRFF